MSAFRARTPLGSFRSPNSAPWTDVHGDAHVWNCPADENGDDCVCDGWTTYGDMDAEAHTDYLEDKAGVANLRNAERLKAFERDASNDAYGIF